MLKKILLALFGVVSLFAVAIGGVGLVYAKPLIITGQNVAEVFEEPEYAEGLDTADAVLDYLAKHPEAFTLVFYSIGEGGQPIDPFSYRGEEPKTLASTMKIVVLAAYAREVVAGRLDPDAPVSIREWERWYLHGTDGAAHPGAMKELGIELDDSGIAVEDAKLALDDVARAMIRFSDNAATDVMVDRLGPEALRETAERLGLRGQEPIRPILGAFLALSNHDVPRTTDALTDELMALSPSDLAKREAGLIAKYATDWGDAERAFRAGGPMQSKIRNQMKLANLMPAGSATDYASIQARVATDTLIDAEVSAIMRRHLEWPMENAGPRQKFHAMGTKGGALAGVLTEATYYAPKTGDFAGKKRVVALFMNDMSLMPWVQLMQTFAGQNFMLEVATDRAFAARVAQTLGAP